MVVDDERIARKGLMSSVNWESLNCKVICEAADGISACSMLQSNNIDIVVTDIRMPGMDGIELGRHIHENYPAIKVIILTGYADFNYAQSAIRYGVVDFILKPIIIQKVIDAVKKATAQLLQQNENLSEMREKFFQDCFIGNLTDSAAIKSKLARLQITLDSYFVVAFEIDKTEDNENGFSPEIHHKFTTAVKNLISLGFKNISYYSVFISSRMICSVLSFTGSDSSDCMQNIMNTCESIMEMLESFTEERLFIGISSMYRSPSRLAEAYSEALDALSGRFYNDSETSIFVPYNKNQSIQEASITNKYIDKIIESLETGNCRDTLTLLHELLERQRALKQPIEHIKNIGLQICSLCSKLLTNHNISFSKVVENGESVYKEILQSRSINHLSEILKNIVKTVSVYLSPAERQNSNIIDRALEYINNNYKENISLQSVADNIHVNSSYLSRLFRKKNGETLVEYITRMRMEKAMELLKNANLQIFEVAALVGIDDPAYFSHLFKKYTGLSPKEYKYK